MRHFLHVLLRDHIVCYTVVRLSLLSYSKSQLILLVELVRIAEKLITKLPFDCYVHLIYLSMTCRVIFLQASLPMMKTTMIYIFAKSVNRCSTKSKHISSTKSNMKTLKLPTIGRLVTDAWFYLCWSRKSSQKQHTVWETRPITDKIMCMLKMSLEQDKRKEGVCI